MNSSRDVRRQLRRGTALNDGAAAGLRPDWHGRSSGGSLRHQPADFQYSAAGERNSTGAEVALLIRALAIR